MNYQWLREAFQVGHCVLQCEGTFPDGFNVDETVPTGEKSPETHTRCGRSSPFSANDMLSRRPDSPEAEMVNVTLRGRCRVGGVTAT